MPRRPYQSKSSEVKINYVSEVPKSRYITLPGQDFERSKEAFRIRDVILAEHPATRACLLVRDLQSFGDIGGEDLSNETNSLSETTNWELALFTALTVGYYGQRH